MQLLLQLKMLQIKSPTLGVESCLPAHSKWPLQTEQSEQFMKRLREERRSSPDVKEWHQFWKELCAHGTGENPPAPLILAANASSAESKWQRLADQ